MSELENIKPVAFYRADWKGDMMFRKNNTIDVRKNESDFTKGWIKPLYDEIPEQPQLTIPKSIADLLDEEIRADAMTKFAMFHEGFENIWLSDELEMYCANHENYALASAYLNPLTRDLVKVVEND